MPCWADARVTPTIPRGEGCRTDRQRVMPYLYVASHAQNGGTQQTDSNTRTVASLFAVSHMTLTRYSLACPGLINPIIPIGR